MDWKIVFVIFIVYSFIFTGLTRQMHGNQGFKRNKRKNISIQRFNHNPLNFLISPKMLPFCEKLKHFPLWKLCQQPLNAWMKLNYPTTTLFFSSFIQLSYSWFFFCNNLLYFHYTLDKYLFSLYCRNTKWQFTDKNIDRKITQIFFVTDFVVYIPYFFI